MFPLADQTAGPNGLIILITLMDSVVVTKAKKIKIVFFSIYLIPRATPGSSASL